LRAGLEGYHRSAEVKHPKCDKIKDKDDGVFEMRKYDKEFKEEAVKLSDEVGVKQAASQLGVPYYTLAEWRQKRKAYGDHAFVGSGIRRDAPLSEKERELMKQVRELQKANEILKDALGFFAKDRKK
jgi:transposase